MNEIVKPNKTTAVAIPAGADPLQAFADAAAPQTIVGKLLRFSKGDWLAGEDDDEIAEGSRFIVSLDDALIGWQKWTDKKPVEQRMVPLQHSYRMQMRNDLGDTDQSAWEKDNRGEPRDPWQTCIYIPMSDTEGNAFTFTSGSKGAIRSIGKLARAVINGRAKHANELPIVAIGTEVYEHAEYGRIKKPVFPVVGWSPRDLFDRAMATAGFVPPTPAASAAVEASHNADMDDEIPF